MPPASLSTLNAVALPKARAAAGRPKASAGLALPATFLRDLGEEDLPALREGVQIKRGGLHGGSLNIQEMKSRHHMLAMVLAGGAPDEEAAFITNYSPGTIATLRCNPMFRELLAYYGSQKEKEWQSFHAKAAAVGLDVLQVLHDRVLNNPEEIKTKDLQTLMDSLLDRTVLPSKAAGVQGGGAQPPPPVNIIQFIESPHAAQPAASDPRLLEGVSYRGGERG